LGSVIDCSAPFAVQACSARVVRSFFVGSQQVLRFALSVSLASPQSPSPAMRLLASTPRLLLAVLRLKFDESSQFFLSAQNETLSVEMR
jgi:hypothetical protein